MCHQSYTGSTLRSVVSRRVCIILTSKKVCLGETNPHLCFLVSKKEKRNINTGFGVVVIGQDATMSLTFEILRLETGPCELPLTGAAVCLERRVLPYTVMGDALSCVLVIAIYIRQSRYASNQASLTPVGNLPMFMALLSSSM